MEGSLDLDSRRRIYDMICSRPGTYMREMERELGMQVGMLTYHLRVLTEAGMIRTEQEGNHLRYFSVEGFIFTDRRMLSHLRNPSTRAILMHALDRENIGFAELLSLLDISKSTLSYHLKRLSSAGMITVEKGAGTMVRVSDPERMAALLVWVGEDVERDAADALVDVWNRLRDR